MATLRRRGVFGYNLPPQVGTVVRPADFGTAGAMGLFARGLDTVVQLNQLSDADILIGEHQPGKFGRYVVDSFFQNLRGTPGRLLVKPFVAADAVRASQTLQDRAGSPEDTLSIRAAYRKEPDLSADGNRTGFTIENGERFSSLAQAAALVGATDLQLASVADVRVGDLLRISGSAPDHYTKVESVDESARTLTVSALAAAVIPGDVVAVLGFRIKTFRRSRNGIVSPVNLPEDNIYLSLEPENSEFFAPIAFQNHPYISLTDLNSTNTLINSWPADVATPVFLSGGSDGTLPTTSGDWSGQYASFDSLAVRWLFNSDSDLTAVNQAGETYCQGRLDTPVWLYSTGDGQTKTELIGEGHQYQRSDQVQGVFVTSRRNVVDPIGFGASPTIPIPINGAIAGNWIRTIFSAGIHRVPAGDDFPLVGFVETTATEDNFTEDERTELLAAGVNVCQFISGRGLIVRSFRTPSTNTGALWGHYLLMQNFIKVSSVESLFRAENRPNRISLIKEYGAAISDFGRKLFKGSFPFGIDDAGAFGDYVKPDGTRSTFEDLFQVQADEFNNTNADLANGDANVFVRFVPPAVTESLGIGVGVLIPL